MLNKERLSRNIAARFELSQKMGKDIIESLFDDIAKEIAAGNDVHIVGFGTFELRTRKSRSGRNPNTGERIQLPESKTPAFKAGRKLRRQLEE